MAPADEAQAERVVLAVTDVLGDTIAAIYLHGSAVLGGLRPTSDLDFLVVVKHPLDSSAREHLLRRLLAVSGRSATYPGRPVEMSVVTTDQLIDWSHPPTAEFQYGEWLRDEYESSHVPGQTVSPDLTVLLDTVHRHGRAVIGPPPKTVVPEIPRADLVAASVAGVQGLLDDLEGDERNVLLTFARMVVTAETGKIVPKDIAADEIAGRLDDGRLLQAAAADYRGRVSLVWDERTADVRAVIKRLIELVESATDRHAP